MSVGRFLDSIGFHRATFRRLQHHWHSLDPAVLQRWELLVLGKGYCEPATGHLLAIGVQQLRQYLLHPFFLVFTVRALETAASQGSDECVAFIS